MHYEYEKLDDPKWGLNYKPQTQNPIGDAILQARRERALILLVPELVEALRETLNEMEAFQAYWAGFWESPPPPSPNTGMKRSTSKAQELARAALAKAEEAGL